MKHTDIGHLRQLGVLKRHFATRRRRFPPVVEPAAMVDVVLLVFLFFIVASSFVTRPGVRLELPEVSLAEGIPLNAVVVTLTQEGVWFFNDRRTRPDELRAAFDRVRFEQPAAILVIEADARVPQGEVMRVFQIAREAGIQDIAQAVRKPVEREAH